MLSQSAFNALLKTLEEPPPHVKFIFATTEPHRIPITILSRCQTFDFRKIPAALIEQQIAAILKEEGITMEPDAVSVVAREAAGSMRDGLSLLDQIIAAYGKTVTTRGVYDLLGIAGAEVNIRLSRAVLSRDVRACLDIVSRLDQEGYNILRFIENYLVHLRDMIVIKAAGKDAPGLALARWEIDDMAAMTAEVELPELYRLFTTVLKAMELAPYSPQPKILFETTLIKLTQHEPLTSIDKLLRRLGDLRRGGALAPAPDAAPSPRPAPARGAQTSPAAAKAPPEPEAPAPEPAGQGAAPAVTASIDEASARQWLEVLKQIADKRRRLAQLLHGALLLRFDARQVKIGFASDGFDCSFVKEKENLDLVRDTVAKVTGAKPEVIVEGRCAEAEEHRRQEEAKFKQRRAKIEEDARSHPVVSEAIKILGGDILDIKTDVE